MNIENTLYPLSYNPTLFSREPYYISCITDVCSDPGTEGVECSAIHGYVAATFLHGIRFENDVLPLICRGPMMNTCDMYGTLHLKVNCFVVFLKFLLYFLKYFKVLD